MLLKHIGSRFSKSAFPSVVIGTSALESYFALIGKEFITAFPLKVNSTYSYGCLIWNYLINEISGNFEVAFHIKQLRKRLLNNNKTDAIEG